MNDARYKVYKHVNKINNKIYIGVTKQDVNRRWRNGKGYVKNIYFSRAIKKYGWDNFEHIILFINLTKTEAEEIEVELIKFHNSNNRKFGYNIENGGNLNKEISEESRLKMSISKKGKMTGINHPNYGKKMPEEQKRKISLTKIKSGVAKGKNNPMYGKHFKHSEETKKLISKKMSGSNNPMYGRKDKDSPNHREIICLNTLQIYNSAKDAGEKLNLFSTNITKVCKGKYSHCGGYKFVYLEDYYKNSKEYFL